MDDLIKEMHLMNHRMSRLEEERLPNRVAQLEANMEGMEKAVDRIDNRLQSGISEIKLEIASQKALVKGVSIAFGLIGTVLGILLTIQELRM